MGMVLCRNCGKKIDETVRVCPHCNALQQERAAGKGSGNP
ncbi:MAG TPA: zinc-ribbon domain-containing protein [Smithella sp.]|nr:zinc-ribbon domain-containing protein [Smithella sp.]